MIAAVAPAIRGTSLPDATPVVVAAVQGRPGILLLRRRKQPFAGLWGLPGGKAQFGEHLDRAVTREVFEEAGIRTRFRELSGVVTEFVYHGRRLERHYLLLVCRLAPTGSRLAGSSEGEVRWFPPAELGRMGDEVIPSDRLMLDRLVFRRPRARYFRCVVRRSGSRYRVTEFE